MTVKIDDNHFSPRSSASRILATALRELNRDSIARKTTMHFAAYLQGLEDLMVVKNPTREFALQAWHAEHLQRAREKLADSYTKWGLPFAEYENILIHRLREARLSGSIMEKMRD